MLRDDALMGQMVDVKIVSTGKHYMMGVPVSSPQGHAISSWLSLSSSSSVPLGMLCVMVACVAKWLQVVLSWDQK